MEKTADIKVGVTPPENDTNEKNASVESLENHVTTRLATKCAEKKCCKEEVEEKK